MTCAACANRIEKSWNKQAGVQSASVNFATARATINYDPTATGVGNLIETVKDIGYDTAGTARAEFVVDDSARPAGSSVQLENHISKVRGVIRVNFNLATMDTAVEYLSNVTDAKTIQRAIEDFGYRVREVSGSAASSEDSIEAAHAAEYSDLKRKFWIAAVLSLPVLVIAMSHGAIEFLNFPGVNWCSSL
jgi:Cu+-exporting ATPase